MTQLSKKHPEADSKLFALRSLLFETEQRQIEDIQQSLLEIEKQADSKEKFSEMMSDALLETLTKVQQRDPRRFTRILSPAVVTSIKQEIANSRDDMVDALYPIAGRMVTASVKSSVQKLSDEINQRFDKVISLRFVFAKIKGMVTGRPVSDFIITGANFTKVNQILLIERKSGTSIDHWSDPSIEPSNVDLVGSLLSAITSFANETYGKDGDSELRAIDLNGKKIAFRQSPLYLLAVEFEGELRALKAQIVDAAFSELIIKIELDELDEDGRELAEIAVNLSGAQVKKTSSSKGITILAILAAVILGYYSWGKYQTWRFDNQVEQIKSIITSNSTLSAFPLKIAGDENANKISISGAVPTNFDISKFSTSLNEIVENNTKVDLSVVSIQDSKVSNFQTQEMNKIVQKNASKLEALQSDLIAVIDQITNAINGNSSELKSEFSNQNEQFVQDLDRIAVVNSEVQQEIRKTVQKNANGLETLQSELSNQNAKLFQNLEKITDLKSTAKIAIESSLQMSKIEQQNSKLSKALNQRAQMVDRNILELQANLNSQKELLLKNSDNFATLSDAVDSVGGDISRILSAKPKTDQNVKKVSTELTSTAEKVEEVRGVLIQTETSIDTFTLILSNLSEQVKANHAKLEHYRISDLNHLSQVDVRFLNDVSYANPELAAEKLQTVKRILLRSGANVLIVGHSDATGTSLQNETIALERASLIMNSLVDMGVDSQQLKVDQRADDSPVKNSEKNPRLNRRVEFEITN